MTKIILESIALLLVISLTSVVLANKDNIHHQKERNPFFLHPSCADILQTQINEEMRASLIYLNMAQHFKQLSVARNGFHDFFEASSKEEREHAKKLMDYVTTRGGAVKPLDIDMPDKSIYAGGLDAMRTALSLEEAINIKLLVVHEKANKVCDDAHLMDFIENDYLTEQVESISQLRRYITILEEMNSGMGEYLFDRDVLGNKCNA